MGEGWSRGKVVKVTRVLVGEGDHVSTVTFLVPCRGMLPLQLCTGELAAAQVFPVAFQRTKRSWASGCFSVG